MPYATVFYSHTDPEFFETLDRYQPSLELRDLVADLCGDAWHLQLGGFWSTCVPQLYEFRSQGWKLHVAGTPGTAADLLRRLVPIFLEEGVAFKFCSDLKMVRLCTSKNWPRASAGKFLTAYPANTQQFLRLADRCHQATADLTGPYILTDRPYGTSRVIFYRYGGHLATFTAESDGFKVPIIFTPEGKEFPDRRVPCFQLPPWIKDPLPQPGGARPAKSHGTVICGGRYQVNRAIRFSSCGGIYHATDRKTELPVILREQRPMVGNGEKTLEKEARILQRLADTSVAPLFLDLFREGDHLFLVEEYLVADSLWTRIMSFTFGNSIPPAPADLFQSIRETIRKLVIALELVHERDIVLRDLTKTNVLLTPNEGSVKFIDFELAYQMNCDDPPIMGSTFGYGSPQQLNNETPTPSDDYYALGALIVDTITVTASGLGLNRPGILTVVRRAVEDFGLPPTLCSVAEGLLERDVTRRLKPREALRLLDNAQVPITSRMLDPEVLPQFSHCPPRDPPSEALVKAIDQTLMGVSDYILKTADYTRQDRLWPSSPEVFITNGVCVRFGAVGIAYYLLRTCGSVPDEIVDWILRALDEQCCPVGVYNGISGIALFLLSLGRVAEAKAVFKRIEKEGQVFRTAGLYDGTAGWGLANLHFWQSTGDDTYLESATEAANHLRAVANVDDNCAFWLFDERVPLGLGSGASGIALFLTYLGTIKNDAKLITLAERALNFELKHASWVGDRVFMHEFETDNPKKSRSPHTKYGSAGVAAAALRLYAVTGDITLRRFAEKSAYTVSTRGTNKLWQDWGLAGFGELLVDAYQFLGDRNYLNTAYYLAERLLDYRMFRPEGIAFAGEELLRISCDYGLGSAGIGIFLHRLQNPRCLRFLFLDDVLPTKRHTSERRVCEATSAQLR